MTYIKQSWHDSPATDTPVSAARLSHIEDGIAAVDAAVANKADTSSLAGKEDKANKNVASGYAGLDATGKVAAAQLPSYVDDVLEFANLAAFPGAGETGKIYTALDSGRIYRWSGSVYVEISPSPGSTDAVTEGVTNLYYTQARVDSRVAAGITGKVDVSKLPVNVLDHGADPTGIADSTSAFTAAIASLPATGGRIYAPAGTYKTSSTLTFLPNQCLRGDGENLTVISYTGTGPCLTTSNPAGAHDIDSQKSSWAFEDLSIDGTNAAVGAMGIRLTNLLTLLVRNTQVRHFHGAGAIGIGYVTGIDPGVQVWQKWCFENVSLIYNTTGLDFNGGNGGYSTFDVYIENNSSQNGITTHNGSQNYLCQWKVRGFFGAVDPVNGAWMFALDPGDPSGTSRWEACSWDVVLQAYPAISTCPSHQTIVMGSPNSRIYGTGSMEFFTFGFSGTNALGASIATGAEFAVSGYVSDPTLGVMVPGYDCAAFQGTTQWSVYGSNTLTLASVLTSGNLRILNADIQEYLLTSGNTAISAFQYGNPAHVLLSPPFSRARKMEFLFHQPASGAPGTITWPGNVKWGGGNGALSTANGAVDKVRFTYMPSTDTWYGEVYNNYTAPGVVAGPSGVFVPADYGYISWTYDPELATGSAATLVAGEAIFSLLPIRSACTITKLMMQVITAGSGLTSGECFAGLFDSSGNLLCATADQSTQWSSTGKKVMTLTTPQAVTAGLYYVGFFANGTTMPKMAYVSTQPYAPNGAIASSPRFAVDTTNIGLTTAFHSPASLTPGGNGYWVAVS